MKFCFLTIWDLQYDRFDGRLAEAIEAWKNALKIDPDVIPSLDSLAKIACDGGY